MRYRLIVLTIFIGFAFCIPTAWAAGGPLGIDHRWHYDNHGIWKRSVQKNVEYATVLTVIGGSFALGDHNDLGDTFWRSLDAVAVSSAAAQVAKLTFQRERPSQTSDHGSAASTTKAFPAAK